MDNGNSQRGNPEARNGREYLVVDRSELAGVLTDAIKRRYGGNRDAAAKAVGIPHSTLKRYQEQRGGAIRHETLERLHRLTGAGRSDRLEAALLNPEARRILADYDRWLTTERSVGAGGSVRSLRIVGAVLTQNEIEREAAVADVGDAVQARSKELDAAVRRLQRRFPELWVPLRRALRTRGHFRPRAAIAFQRVLAPLFDSLDTHGIERSIQELSEAELRDFIKAGVRREIILLARETDVRRAQEAAKRHLAESAEVPSGLRSAAMLALFNAYSSAVRASR